ncbi:AAA domain-containing protein [Candidatus Clostridium stratigraminis]|uniref:AAA domain-containing protein n=1 Tax=Candidatus Clostridium stratigraminis TaxID=3381661 RepID=A0ABW8T6R6_9CLOT
MNTENTLILIKNNKTNQFEDKTSEIGNLNFLNSQVAVTFTSSNKTYNYKSVNIRILKDPKLINLEQRILLIEGFPIKSSSKVLDFGEYIKVIEESGRSEAYHKSKVSFENSCLNDKQPKIIFNYLKELSSYVSVMEDGRTMLAEQYGKISKISEKSVLAAYLSREDIRKKSFKDTLIFPFGFNLSQKKAVITALENSISIIEGPPGTGKTQTILNIIANAVAKGKTVGIVSGNNSATSNVQEKLEKNGYGFITSLLGNTKNKADFFENKQSKIPNIENWYIEKEKVKTLSEQLNTTSMTLNDLLEKQNEIAKLKEELSKLEVEQSYFENNFNDSYIPASRFSFHRRWTTQSILEFLTYLEKTIDINSNRKILTRVYLIYKYGIYKFKLYENNMTNIISSLKRDYYISAIDERKKRIALLELRLEGKSFKELMEKYTDISAKLFKAALFNKYSIKNRENFTIKSYKARFKEFINEYPVILSTTHSILNSVTENYLFDYIIIDESSQVDLVTASLALACCKNVVIVGDVKQLPQIVPSELEKISDEHFYKANIPNVYNYSEHSIIASLMKLYKEALPKTLLSEHYRCHPKIIGFCNEKFYNNELIVMTEETPEDTPLKLYKTAPGNHARRIDIGNQKGWYNLRQIEVIKDEILSKNKNTYKDPSKIGIICPYRNQVNETNRLIGKEELEVDTVHKFQGREKDTIIFTTVANDINPFIDDANLINVAVSRAVKEFIVVTSNKVFKQHGTNIGDLIRYIEYNSFDNAIIESQKISVFDLLYSEYSGKLLKYMNSKKHVSEYQSENLMYRVIDDALSLSEFSSFKCVIHVPLNSIVKDTSRLSSDECNFAQNPWSHVDFLIFNKQDKEPVLAVEVDGHEFHRNNEKQLVRDKLKDEILEKVNLPILRIATNESGEKEKLIEMLNKVVKMSVYTIENT